MRKKIFEIKRFCFFLVFENFFIFLEFSKELETLKFHSKLEKSRKRNTYINGSFQKFFMK